MFDTYPHIGNVLPAVGYGSDQLRELETIINATDADLVLAATPVDLARLLRINKRIVRAYYDSKLSTLVDSFLDRIRGNPACSL
jgi:predicted GTPase